MDKAIIVLVFLSLIFTLSVAEVVNANPVAQKPIYDTVTIISPQKITYTSNNISLNFTSRTNSQLHLSYTLYFYKLDGNGSLLYGNVINLLSVDQEVISQTVISDDIPSSGSTPYPQYTEYVYQGSALLPPLVDGNHNLTIYQGPKYENNKAYYEPLCTTYFTIETPKETDSIEIIVPPTEQPTNYATPTPTLYVEKGYYGVDYTLRIITISLLAIAAASILLVYFKRRRNKLTIKDSL